MLAHHAMSLSLSALAWLWLSVSHTTVCPAEFLLSALQYAEANCTGAIQNACACMLGEGAINMGHVSLGKCLSLPSPAGALPRRALRGSSEALQWDCAQFHGCNQHMDTPFVGSSLSLVSPPKQTTCVQGLVTGFACRGTQSKTTPHSHNSGLPSNRENPEK